MTKVEKKAWFTRITVRWPNGDETQFDDPYDRHQAVIGQPWMRYEETR